MRANTAASIVASLLVVALLSGYAGSYLGPTRTVTIVHTSSESGASGTSQVYAVTFEQVRYCGLYNIFPWAVTIDGMTQVQPHNQSLPLPTNTFSTRVTDQNLTRMTFYLPAGTYNYTLTDDRYLFNELYTGNGNEGGVVEVNGSNVIVSVDVSLSFTCVSSSTSSSTSSSQAP